MKDTHITCGGQGPTGHHRLEVARSRADGMLGSPLCGMAWP